MKGKIENDLKLGEASLQKLILQGKILKDDRTIASLNLKPKDFLVVVCQKAKRKAPEEAEVPASSSAANDAAAAPAASAATPAVPAAAAAGMQAVTHVLSPTPRGSFAHLFS